GYEKKACVGDHILMVGGRIGKDGIHGATFSSEPLHEGSPATAVQIGDPITQKRMTDFLLRARDSGLYNAITDNGAGGLSSSVGEMAQDTGGAVVHLERAPLKYHGLEPWEIFLSEAQERMTVAVPPGKLEAFLALAKGWAVEATDLGEFTDDGFLDVRYNGTTVAELSMDFLHNGLPKMELVARWKSAPPEPTEPVHSSSPSVDIIDILKRLNVCSKEYVVRQYDHEVQGGSIVKPLCGVRNDGPSDAAVVRPLLDSFEGVVVSHGIAPRYSDIDTYAMATCAVDEAVRNAVAAGVNPDHLAALDNFCWCDPIAHEGNPDGEYKLAQLVRANQALHDMCLHYLVPLISGKDSMKNDYRIGDTRISIPPTLLVSVVGKIDDVRRAVTMDLKNAGNYLYIIGNTYRELGASEYALMKGMSDSMVPRVHSPARSLKIYRCIHTAISKGLVRACHDISDGGLGVALAEMCFSGEFGASIELAEIPQQGCTTDTELVFSESPARLLLEIPQECAETFEGLTRGLPCAQIGTVQKGDMITIKGSTGDQFCAFSRIDAKAAWKATIDF
ncbi:MAG: phosphoribosylformylglycinamidine synthase, partial [Chitinivibrionales bacterium]|nr:phosphoribosylformylglycinamidine synthase [Chitinivibrionales bacterium]